MTASQNAVVSGKLEARELTDKLERVYLGTIDGIPGSRGSQAPQARKSPWGLQVVATRPVLSSDSSCSRDKLAQDQPLPVYFSLF